jgi:hypothetical protein
MKILMLDNLMLLNIANKRAKKIKHLSKNK